MEAPVVKTYWFWSFNPNVLDTQLWVIRINPQNKTGKYCY